MNIWPRRVINLPHRVHGDMMFAALFESHVAQVNMLLEGHPSRLDKPVKLDNDEYLIALVVLGKDAVGGSNDLLLRVTNTYGNRRPTIKLTVISYAATADTERPYERINPARAGEILDEYVDTINAIPGLVPQTYEVRDYEPQGLTFGRD
jgi:hypothetical protein